MGGKVCNIARDYSTLHHWDVIAKPVDSECILTFNGAVEAITTNIRAAAVGGGGGGRERRVSENQRQLGRTHGPESQQM